MEAKGAKALTGISRWACPWPAEMSKTRTTSHSSYECNLLIPRDSDRSATEEELPKYSRRRLQTIGFAATGVAASVWLMAVIWVWQIVA
ncbi:MAG: hypothetical protein ACXW16_06370 [Burkholderiaceae bacterium]